MKRYFKSRIFIFFAFLVVLAGGLFLSKFNKKRPDLSVVGYINMADGLGRQGPELVCAFKKNLKVNFHVTRKMKGGKTPKGFDKYIAKSNEDWGKVVVFEDILWEPNCQSHAEKLKNCPTESIKLAYSMWESTRIPREWVNILNRKFDAVIVPSEFLIETYQESGVEIPIFVIPLALDFKHFFRQPLKKEVGETFVFGNFSAGSDRKNHVNLIRAFHKAFGGDPSVQLIINNRYAEKEVRNAITKELAIIDAKNIVFSQRSLSKGEYIKKFSEIDCYVSPSKGEGFSIQPREAMALGIPVIATNNTGQVDICKSGLVKAVQTPLAELASNPWGDYYGKNFNCEVDVLARALIDMRNNYQSYLDKGEEARKWSKQFLFSNLKDLYASVITPRRVILGNENKVTSTYIMTDSLKLFRKYKKTFGKEVCLVDNQRIFTSIYETAEWGVNERGEGFSGEGSTIENAQPYVDLLTDFIEKNNIQSVVDMGCGDWTFSKHMNWDNIEYTGIDVVKFLIDRNQKLYSAPNIRFLHADATDFNLPKADLLICKDVMQHLSNKSVAALVVQLKKYKHCLITNDVDPLTGTSTNPDINNGDLRFLDLIKAPFNLDAEEILIYEPHGVKKLVLHLKND